MTTEYRQDELLALSGIQHFYFCRRQWALIHIEKQWAENVYTVEGKQLHDRADDPFFNETRNGKIISRSLPVASYKLGLYGICDVVEFTPAEGGIHLQGKPQQYTAMPIEYKRGRVKPDHRDEIQLCAQAICLEDMLSVTIPAGAIFYAQTRRRELVQFTQELRELVQRYADEMHQYYKRGYTPKVRPTRACKSCSLKDICMPELLNKRISAAKYIDQMIGSE